MTAVAAQDGVTDTPPEKISLLEKIKILRKTNIQKARKLQRRLKSKTKRTDNYAESTFLPNGSVPSTEKAVVQLDEEELSTADDEEAFVVRSFEEELLDICSRGVDVGSAQDLLEVKQAIDRFLVADETRASGKGGGGGMEDFGMDDDEHDDRGLETDAEEHDALPGGEHEKEGSDNDDDDHENGNAGKQKGNRLGLSKKKLKQLRRPAVSQLKRLCARPEVVESWDSTAPDPAFLVYLKAHRNTVPVPPHWSHKRRYLQGKRGLEKSPFVLPHYIEATRISEIRKAIEDKDSKKTLKQRMREKVRPRHRKMNIDYQTLHDAFFKYATKPTLTKFGDVYFEGKETEMLFRRYTPGKLSARCRDALGMTSPLDAPPWLIAMQRYGPPPSFPNLVVPGVNAHVPEGAALGFQPGGWGKPPGLDQLKLWGVTPRFEEVVLGEDQLEGLDHGGDGGLWGVLQNVESDEEDEGSITDEVKGEEADIPDAAVLGMETPSHVGMPGHMTPVAFDPSGMASVASLSTGFITPGLQVGGTGGMDSVSSAIETPQSVDLRRSGFASDHAPKPYTVLERTKAPAQPGALFASGAIYSMPVEKKNA